MMNGGGPGLMNQQMGMAGAYPVRMMNGVHAGQDGAGSPGDMAHKAGQQQQQQQLQRNAMQRAAAAGRYGPHSLVTCTGYRSDFPIVEGPTK